MTEQKETVKTPYGETTIKTYDCDSCGNTVAYENTVEFTIGETNGRACEHCEENGPISFPRRALDFCYPKNNHASDEPGLLFHIVLVPIFLPVITIAGLTNRGKDFDKGYSTAVLTILFWVIFFNFIVFLIT